MVFVKPAAARCTSRWPIGRVTSVLSDQAIEVDGMPRHIADCRPVRKDSSTEDMYDSHGSSSSSEESDSDHSDDDRTSEEQPATNPWRGRLRQNVLPPDRFM